MNHSKDHPKNESPPLEEGQRKLTTIMFSDICGYTRMMGKNEAKTLQLVKRNLELHQELLKKYHGTLVKEMGDGLLTCFDSPSDAVGCAKEILTAVSFEEELNLHIGIHQGEVIFTENDVYGEGVNITARIDSEAWPGEILVSEDVWKNIRNKDEFFAISIGKKQMKNVAESMELYRILITDEDNSKKYQQFLRRRKAPLQKFGLMVVAGLIIAAFFIWYNTYYYAPIEDYKSIAILPFQNKTNNEELNYLSEGLADDVIKQFSHLSALSVISSRSSFRFKETDKTINQLSKELNADLIMDGSYSIQGDMLHVKIELIAGKTNEIICYASPIASLEVIKNIATEIEKEVFKSLNISGRSEEQISKNNKRTVNVEAYKYYVLGKNAMRDNALQDIEYIIKYFDKAIELDSTYADPYIGKAEAYFFDLNRGYSSINEASPLIREYTMRAEHLKPGSGEVQGLLGALSLWEYQTNDAIQYLENSIQITPNYDFSYSHYAYTLAFKGQFEQAIIMIDKACILDPLNNFYRVFEPLYLTFQAKYDEAQELLETELKLNPDNPHLLWLLAVLHIQKKDYLAAYEVLLKRGVGLETNFVAGYTYAMLGMDKEADVVLTNMLEKSRKGFVPLSQLAILYVGLGRYDKAIEQVEQAYLTRDSWIFWVKYSAMMDPIQDDPRFIKVMAMVND